MENQEILSQINGLVAGIFKKDKMDLTMETVAADVDGWDSLRHMMIIDKIEKHFSVKFKLMEVMNFKNMGDIVACVAKKAK
jgi:acyl carrier protein